MEKLWDDVISFPILPAHLKFKFCRRYTRTFIPLSGTKDKQIPVKGMKSTQMFIIKVFCVFPDLTILFIVKVQVLVF